MKLTDAEFKDINIKVKKGAAILTVSRPKLLNVLNEEVLDEIGRALEMIINDEDVSVLIITGEGKAFIAGADISMMRDMNSSTARILSERAGEIFDKLENMDKPTIALINGFAMGGGCELALCCDIRIAGESAVFAQPEVLLGIMPGFGGTVRLPRVVGPAKAKELIFTGEKIDAAEAERIGLVNRVVKDSMLMEAAMELAEKISSNGQIAVRYSKKSINNSLCSPGKSAFIYESSLFGHCFSTEDQLIGMNAFLDKKKPKFTGK